MPKKKPIVVNVDILLPVAAKQDQPRPRYQASKDADSITCAPNSLPKSVLDCLIEQSMSADPSIEKIQRSNLGWRFSTPDFPEEKLLKGLARMPKRIVELSQKYVRAIVPQNFAWQAMRSLAEDTDAQRRLAEAAIDDIEKHPAKPDETKALTSELACHTVLLLEFLKMDEDPPAPNEPWPEHDGMLWLDALGADYLEKIGGSAAEKDAAALRNKRRGPWDEWTGKQLTLPNVKIRDWRPVWRLWFDPTHEPTPVKFARILARDLWLDVVKPRLEQERHTPTALSLPFFEGLAKPMRPGVSYDGKHLIDGAGVVIGSLADDIIGVPAVDLEILERLTAYGAKMLFSVSGFRLVWWLADKARRQMVIERSDTPWVIETDGGWSELARTILTDLALAGMANVSESKGFSKRIPGELKAISIALARGWWPQPDGSTGNLLILHSSPARGRRRAKVRFELAACWLPFNVRTLPRQTPKQRRARTLSPMLPPPVAIAGRRTHASQAALAWDLVAEMTRQRRDVAHHGGLVLTRDTRLVLERRAGLTSETTADRVWYHWHNIGFTAEPEPGLIQLGDLHPEAWRFIVKGGEVSNAAAKGKHKRARKKRVKTRK